MRILLFLLLGATLPLTAQQKAISLEDIWSSYIFSPDGVSGFNFLQDGSSYAELEGNAVVTYDITTGEVARTLVDGNALPTDGGFSGRIDDYTLSDDEKKILISSETEQLFRRSSQSNYFVYDVASGALNPVYPEGKIRLATLDPTGRRVAFVVDNNVHIRDLSSGRLTQVTEDGEVNAIINGATDWVYEEEFGFSKALYWSPDGKRLAYLKFDERAVPEFTYTDFHDGAYPEYNTFKYPKVGEENSTVSLHVYHLEKDETTDLLTVNGDDSGSWHYLPRVQWTTEAGELTAQRMNRHQNELELLLFDLKKDKQRTLLAEKNPYYVDVHDNLTFLDDSFIWTSEQDGYNQIYLYGLQGGKPQQITADSFDVTEFYGVHDGRIYFQAAGRNPMQREVYTKQLKGKDRPRPLAAAAGYNDAQFSGNYDYFVLTNSTINRPAKVVVMDHTGTEIREIVTNQELAETIQEYGYQPAEFFTFTTEEGTELNGYMIKPASHATGQQHPLLMHVYGGPGSQQVLDNWRGQNMAWFQLLAQKGFVVAVVDNRGTGARGQELKKQTYLTLGKQETEDQISAAKYLGSLDFIDANRIGIFGWSYGGFMALHGILQGNDVFAAAIAVAPVTNWKWYDTIYTERYMRTYAENKEGYDRNSPINYADQLRGDLLLVHGMGDDNVHFQHTAEMANALIMNNKQFETYFYPNRNHGIYGGPTRLHLYTKMTNFLLDHLGQDTNTK
ncbi:dipeptidyl-peptidase-4 [Lewinella marina]|uniref:S9 family peptidase n=1 Tax=Neolewinella marina TaxID=438751 RepID=A0A2G0CDX7_9BACT|nr:S9 family peptidase [Neolewinella marina]NJB87515.1 dipeptidyl-peptidase-4 [Neolewinella marina]PHK98179.1 S9 family peptidase [Neolewinella marina]